MWWCPFYFFHESNYMESLKKLIDIIISIMTDDGMQIVLYGRGRQKITFYTCCTDDQKVLIEVIYVKPIKHNCFIETGGIIENANFVWTSSIIKKNGGSSPSKLITPEMNDPSWVVDKKSLGNALTIIKHKIDYYKQSEAKCLDLLNFFYERRNHEIFYQ